MGNIRGLSLSSAVKYVKTTYGDEGLAKVIEAMPEEYRKHFSGDREPMQWYPMKGQEAFMHATEKTFGKGDYQECAKIGRFSCEDAFGGLYKMFLEMGKPHTIIRRGPLAWRLINETGELEIEVMSEQETKAKITEFEDPDKCHCWYLVGYFEKILELSGGKNVKVKELQCMLEGADCCEYEATWE